MTTQIHNHSRPNTESVEITKTCGMCNTIHVFKLPKEDVMKCWRFNPQRKGVHIQIGMPYLSRDESEILISGTCGPCFDKMFKEEEEE